MNNFSVYKILKISLSLFLVIIIGFPVLMMISISLQDMNEIYSDTFVFFPEKLNFINYADAMKYGDWGRYIFNSIFVTTITVVVSLFINSITGYAFSRIQFKGKRILFILLLTGMMVPPQVTLIPVYQIISGLGMVNTYAGLILPYIAGSFGVFLCYQFYSTFPKSIDDAASIDGGSRFKTYIHIYLPLSGPVLASLGIIKFIGTWNEYTWPLICTPFSDEMRTVQIALTSFRNEGEVFYNQLMAATLITSLIVYVPFLFLQKYFAAGFMAGSVKE